VAASIEPATCDGQFENLTAKIDSFCCFKFQLATCSLYQLSVASTASAVSEVAVLHRRYAVFLPV